MPTLDDELLWCPDNDGHIVDSLALGQGAGCMVATADDGNAAAMLEMQQQQMNNGNGSMPQMLQIADLPSTSACDQLNNIAQLPDDPEFLGQLTELESLFGENLFPVSIADIKEENNNDLSLDDEQDYLTCELPSSSSNNNNNTNINITQQQLLGLQVLIQQQQQQQQQQQNLNNNRYSIAANPLLAEKLSAPTLTNLDSLANVNRGRPPDIKGKSTFNFNYLIKIQSVFYGLRFSPRTE
uniref:CSON000199 protein n=1 Tax=Culicoides sonorensis TaxID=179676 RepID=A0A336KV69_CULSO